MTELVNGAIGSLALLIAFMIMMVAASTWAKPRSSPSLYRSSKRRSKARPRFGVPGEGCDVIGGESLPVGIAEMLTQIRKASGVVNGAALLLPALWLGALWGIGRVMLH